MELKFIQIFLKKNSTKLQTILKVCAGGDSPGKRRTSQQVKELLQYIIDSIEKLKIRYKVHSFESGAIMVDLWIHDEFYVIQIDGDKIGLSLITKETTPFDIIPDRLLRIPVSLKLNLKKYFHKAHD